MKFFSRWLIVIFGMFGLLFQTNGQSISLKKHHQSSAPSYKTVPFTTVYVGVDLLNIQNLDLTNGQYDIDCYLIFNCYPSCKYNNFEVMNGTTTLKNFEDGYTGHPHGVDYRYQAKLYKKFNLSQFPFDKHKLDLILEDKLSDIHHLIYKVDASSTMIDEFFSINGWNFSPKWQAKVIDHTYPVFDQVYSRYVFDIQIFRPWLSSFLKFIVPAAMFFLAGFLALFMKPPQVGDRLTLAATAMVGSVVFHLAVTSTLPPLGYLTFFDSYMIVNYMCLLGALIGPVTSHSYHHRGQVESAIKVDRIFMGSILVVWILLQTYNAFSFFG